MNQELSIVRSAPAAEVPQVARRGRPSGAGLTLHAIALAAMQLTVGSALVGWHAAARSDCPVIEQATPDADDPDADTDVDPDPTLEDVADGQVISADPIENGAQSPDEDSKPDPVVSPTAGHDAPDNGDNGDGGTAEGDPGGTDGGGGEGVSSPTTSASIGGMQVVSTTESDVLFGPVGGVSMRDYTIVSDPIDLLRADKSHVQVDYLSQGAAELRMARVYHSNSAVNVSAVTVNMGVGWHMFYDRSLQKTSSTTVRLHRANGQALDFTFNGSAWISALPAGVLTPISGGWTYVNRRDGIETYDTNGRLVGMAHAGLALAMQYDASGHLVRVTNPFGRALSLAYDGSGRVSVVTLPGSGTLRYGYDGQGNLVSTQFADGAMRQYVYDNAGYPHALTGVVDESGRRRLTWNYDASGRPAGGFYGAGTAAVAVTYNGDQVTAVDPHGTQRTRTIGTVAGRQVLVALSTSATTSSAATAWSFGYDANGNAQTVTSRTGEVHQLANDARGRVQSSTRAAGTQQATATQTAWHPTYHVPTQIVRAGVTRNYVVDAAGRVTQVTRVSGSTSVVTYVAVYNAQNLLQSTTNARGTTLSYTYDAAGNRASMTNSSLGQTTYFSGYNAHGQATVIQRPDGTTVTRNFDTRGRMTSRSDAGGTTAYGYDGAGRLLQITAPDGSWTTRGYDAAGLLASITNNRNETTTYLRDAGGRITSINTYSAGGVLTAQARRTVDAVGRTASVIDSRGYSTQLLYGTDGRLAGATDALGLTVTLQLDPLNRPVALTQPNTSAMRQGGGGATTTSRFTYNSANKAATIVDTNGVSTSMSYDAFNRKAGEAGSDAGGSAVVRNAAGDVVSHTDPLGNTLGLTRDAIGRLTAITWYGTPDRSFNYVPGRRDGLLASVSDSFGSTESWSYDSAGRLLTQQQNVYGVQHTLRIQRDSLGRPTGMTYPSGMVVGTAYNADVVSGLTVNGSSLLSSVTYLPQTSLATGWRWGNGSAYARAFDLDGRVTSVSLGTIQRSYGYDAVGRLTSQKDVGPAGTQQFAYAYDEAGQLTGFNSPTQSLAYTYDTNGNRQSQAGSLGAGGV